jgi:hypothetical protein
MNSIDQVYLITIPGYIDRARNKRSRAAFRDLKIVKKVAPHPADFLALSAATQIVPPISPPDRTVDTRVEETVPVFLSPGTIPECLSAPPSVAHGTAGPGTGYRGEPVK